MSLKKSILKNGISAAFQKGVKVAEQLLLVPFFIQYWGAAYYGEWLTLTILPATLALADLGFGSAAANTFLLKYASGDKQGAANVSKTGTTILTFLIVAAILLSTVIIFILNYFQVFEKSLINSTEAMVAVLLLLISRIINFYQSLFEAYFRAARRANISINIRSLIAIVNLFAGLLVLLTGGRVVEYSSVMLVVALILNPIYIFTARNTLALHKTHAGKIERQQIKPLIVKGFGYFLSPIWQAIYYQGMTFVVRITLGPVSVTIFNTVRTLVRSSAQAFGMAITASYPDFQFEIGAGNLDKAKRIFLGLLIVNIAISILFIFILSFFGETIYNWWTKNALIVPSDIWFVFISGILFYALWFTFSFIFEALNKPYAITVSGLICSLLGVVISWILCKAMGIMGAAVGCLFFDFLMSSYLVQRGMRELMVTFPDIRNTFSLFLRYPLKKFTSR